MPEEDRIQFERVEEFLDYLSLHQLKIVEMLRKIIFDCIPDAKEKLSYNVPFYYRHSRICFIWPGEVPWGRVKKEGVEIGFCKGHLLSDPSYLNKGSRKEVYIKTFYQTKDIDTETLRLLLYEAVLVDEAGVRKRK